MEKIFLSFTEVVNEAADNSISFFPSMFCVCTGYTCGGDVGGCVNTRTGNSLLVEDRQEELKIGQIVSTDSAPFGYSGGCLIRKMDTDHQFYSTVYSQTDVNHRWI